jgi:hypothetical protein
MSTLKVNAIKRYTGTTITIGESGDTITIASGAAMGGSGASLTDLNASQITSGTIPDDARLPTVGVDKGGTNLTSYAVGDILYASGTTTLSKLVKPGTPADEVLTFATGASAPSWVESAGGISWQSVETSTVTAVAGEGYPINTTSGEITINLPAGVVGEQVAVVDYAGTFDTNKLIVSSNGSEKIKGTTDDYTMKTERQAGVLTYVDATQGWVLTSAAPDPGIAINDQFVAATGPDGSSGATDGDYKVHTFTATKTGSDGFVVTNVGNVSGSNTIDYLVIAGGAAGGLGHGGGGGGGGYRNSYGSETSGGGGSSETSMTCPAIGNYNVTIGAGGAGISVSAGLGNDGSDTTLSTTSAITSVGGGGGGYYAGSYVGIDGNDGGCGGGGGGGNAPIGAGGSGTTNQGYDGGHGEDANSAYHIGAGGGGAGAVGANGVGAGGDTGAAGAGGAGLSSSITGAAVTRDGGGGGSGEGGNVTVGAGGSGGGGAGTKNTTPGVAGTVNTGSGGGAVDSTALTGAGGSGVVIIRYKFQ